MAGSAPVARTWRHHPDGHSWPALELDERELITLYYGAAVTAAEADAVAAQIQAQYPDIEVEILAGGQAYYDFIIGCRVTAR